MLLSLAMELARGSCHCKTCRSVLVIANRTCPQFLSLRRNVVTDAISLSTDRNTPFAMTILNLSLRAVQKARRGNLLAMTTCQQMATRLKASRHDKLFFCDSRLLKFYRNPLRSVLVRNLSCESNLSRGSCHCDGVKRQKQSACQ